MNVLRQARGVGVVAVAVALMWGVGHSPVWAEEGTEQVAPIVPVAPLVEPDLTNDEAPENDAGSEDGVSDGDIAEVDPGAREGLAGVGAAVLGPAEGTPEGLARPEPPALVAEFALSPMEAKPGGQVRFSGKCLLYGFPGDRASVRAYWANEAEDMDLQKAFSLRTEKINDDGTFDQLLTIPLEATPGVYDVPEPICGLQDQVWNSNEDPQRDLGTFTVLGADTPGGGGDTGSGDPVVPVLAETGGSASLVLLWGAVTAGFLGAGSLARARYAARWARV